MTTLVALQSLITQGESDMLELKHLTAELKRAGEMLCVFLNGDGSTVLIGVGPDGRLVGQEDADIALRDIAAMRRRSHTITTSRRFARVDYRPLKPHPPSSRAHRIDRTATVHVDHVNMEQRTKMASKHNITLAIEPALLKKARVIAARRGRSVSALLADELRELVAQDAQYATARKRALALFASPLPLGGIALSRDKLHERRRLR
jgi:hypothetical protein